MTTNALVHKVGRNYLLDIGKLIGGQVKVDEEELERDHGVHMSNTRAFKYRIELEVPEVFTVQGLDKLKYRVENSQGGFTSSAKMEGNTLIVETHKHYDSIEAKKEDWPNIVAFLNAAHTFSEQKILLKKK